MHCSNVVCVTRRLVFDSITIRERVLDDDIPDDHVSQKLHPYRRGLFPPHGEYCAHGAALDGPKLTVFRRTKPDAHG